MCKMFLLYQYYFYDLTTGRYLQVPILGKKKITS
jgi:hypothetical protein